MEDVKAQIQCDSLTTSDVTLMDTDGNKFSCNRRKRPLKDKKESTPTPDASLQNVTKKTCSVYQYVGDVFRDLDATCSFDIYPGVCFPTFRLYTNAILWVILSSD